MAHDIDGPNFPNQLYGWVKEEDGTWSLYSPDGSLVIASRGNRAQVSEPTSDYEIANRKYVLDNAGGLPAGGTTGEVLTKASDADGDADWEAGGGSQPGFEYVRTTFSFDTPNLAVQAFPITGVDLMTNTVTVAGDHTALFPAGRRALIAGSSGNDYDGYLILSSSFGGGNTSVVFDPDGALPADPTADGDLVNNGTAGITVATLGEGDALLLPGSIGLPSLVIFIPTAFNGTLPNLQLYPTAAELQGYYPILNANYDMTSEDDDNNFAGLWRDQSAASLSTYNPMYPTSGTGSVVAQLFDNTAHGAPGSTAGEGVCWIPVLRA